MAHPFFDSSSYPWHRADARVLHEELYVAISNANAIDLVYKSCGPQLLTLAVEPPHLMWKAALQALSAAQLLVDLGKHINAYPKAYAAFEQIRNAIDPLLEPGATSDTIFVNRVKGRDALGKLARESATISVLLVRGSSSSGKSWTRHVVKEQADALGHGCIYLCQGMIATVEDALDRIFAALGESTPPRLTTEAAWFNKACNDMLKFASQKQKRFWIVADDLGSTEEGPLLDDLVRQLFDKMALNMLDPAFARWFRLVLIDYPDGVVPTKWKGFWVEDRPTEIEVQVDDVTEFLRRWIDRRQKVLPEDELKKHAADVIAKVDAPVNGETRPRLERIHDELSAVIASI